MSSRGIPVIVPSPSRRHESSREATVTKLARNVAALFGVPVPDPKVQDGPWLCDYNELTNVDLGKGSPPGWEPLDGKKIASATLSNYKPEVKAALVLVGTNRLLEPVIPGLTDVLEMTRLGEDGQALADACRVSIWASLQLDVFAAQPTLMLSAYRARAIQRAARNGWRPVVDVEPLDPPEEGARRVEYGHRPTDHGASPDHEPWSLSVVDDLMQGVVEPTAVSQGEGEMSSRLMVDEAINRLLAHLVEGLADASYARIGRGEDTRRRVDVVVNRSGLLSALLEANLRVFSHVQAIGRSEGKVPFDATDSAHWLRLLPRIPSNFELLRLDPPMQRCAIRALDELTTALRGISTPMPNDVLVECRKRLERLLGLSEDLLGEQHEQTLLIRTRYHGMLFNHLRQGYAAQPFDRYPDLDSLCMGTVDSCTRLFEMAHTWHPGEWLHVLNGISSVFSMAIVTLTDRRPDLAGESSERQRQEWARAFERMGVDLVNDPLEELYQRCAGLTTCLHDWTAVATRVGQPLAERIHAIDVALAVTLPLRQRQADARRHDRPLRLTLQVLGRAISDALNEELDPATRDRYSGVLFHLEERFLQTARVRYLSQIDLNSETGRAQIDQLNIGDIHALSSFVAMALKNMERDPDADRVGRIDHALDLWGAIFVHKHGKIPDNDLARKLTRLRERRDRYRQPTLTSA